jgi:hypothetical protein
MGGKALISFEELNDLMDSLSRLRHAEYELGKKDNELFDLRRRVGDLEFDLGRIKKMGYWKFNRWRKKHGK